MKKMKEEQKDLKPQQQFETPQKSISKNYKPDQIDLLINQANSSMNKNYDSLKKYINSDN